jgi:hypothetical protein
VLMSFSAQTEHGLVGRRRKRGRPVGEGQRQLWGIREAERRRQTREEKAKSGLGEEDARGLGTSWGG